MRKRTAIISCLAIPGFPIGSSSIKNVDIFTRDYGPFLTTDSPTMTKKDEFLQELHAEVMPHIDKYGTVYLHIDRFPDTDECDKTFHLFEMIDDYVRAGKHVVLVGCDCCSSAWKQQIITRSNGKVVWEKITRVPEKQLIAIIEKEVRALAA